MRSALVRSFALVLVVAATLQAQDLEPRAYSNSPIGLNFAIAGYAYAKGDVLTDPSLPLENVSNDRTSASSDSPRPFVYSANLGNLISSCLSLARSKGVAFGMPRSRHVSGFADPAFRLSMNFIGAPALTAAEFKNYRQDFIVGGSFRLLHHLANTTATDS